LTYLRDLAQTERVAFLHDPVMLGGAKYYLQISIETCLNLGAHLISAKSYRAPKDYRDIFTVLEEQQILPTELTRRLRQMAGLRNRLVHLYWEVDDEQIYAYLQQDLGDFDAFAQRIVAFVAGQ
jgi:uncharacterized protein YutE (UPF0331/DUF86 family)